MLKFENSISWFVASDIVTVKKRNKKMLKKNLLQITVIIMIYIDGNQRYGNYQHWCAMT